jgi:hypothetical protein
MNSRCQSCQVNYMYGGCVKHVLVSRLKHLLDKYNQNSVKFRNEVRIATAKARNHYLKINRNTDKFWHVFLDIFKMKSVRLSTKTKKMIFEQWIGTVNLIENLNSIQKAITIMKYTGCESVFLVDRPVETCVKRGAAVTKTCDRALHSVTNLPTDVIDIVLDYIPL